MPGRSGPSQTGEVFAKVHSKEGTVRKTLPTPRLSRVLYAVHDTNLCKSGAMYGVPSNMQCDLSTQERHARGGGGGAPMVESTMYRPVLGRY